MKNLVKESLVRNVETITQKANADKESSKVKILRGMLGTHLSTHSLYHSPINWSHVIIPQLCLPVNLFFR
jgi:hypothetical protein